MDIRYLLSASNDPPEPKTPPVPDEAMLLVEDPLQVPSSSPTPAHMTTQDNENPAVQEHSFVKTTFSKRK